jgi:hypothetical protein
MIEGKEVHGERELVIYSLSFVSGLVAKRCDFTAKMLGVACGGGLKVLSVGYRVRFSDTATALTARRVRHGVGACQPAALLTYMACSSSAAFSTAP